MAMNQRLTTEQLCKTIARTADRIANPQFLLDVLFTQDDSQFVDSSYRMVAKATIPASTNVRETLIKELPQDCNRSLGVYQAVTRYADNLPGQVKTLVDVPRDTPAIDSMSLAREMGKSALRVSLMGHTPFAALYA